MHIDQAEKSIGATVAHLGFSTFLIGRIDHCDEQLVWVRFESAFERGDKAVIPVFPHHIVFFYGPVVRQMIRNVLIDNATTV